MVYVGSKSKIAKYILPIILKDRKPGQWYVEPFAGGMNTICLVEGNRIASDANKYLMEMWRALKYGMTMPEEISEEMYWKQYIEYDVGTEECMHITGWVGFLGSFSGIMFGGYCRPDKKRDRIAEMIRNIKRQIPLIKGVELDCKPYNELLIPENSIIYCDPPYKNKKKYRTAEEFNHERFYNWCLNMHKKGHTIFVSENEMPEPFKEVWSMPVKRTLSTKSVVSSIERLYTL